MTLEVVDSAFSNILQFNLFLVYWSSISASRESRVNNWRQGIDALTRTPGISHGIAVSNRLGGLAQRLSASAQRRVFKTINKSRTRSLLDLTDDDELEEQEYKETRRGQCNAWSQSL